MKQQQTLDGWYAYMISVQSIGAAWKQLSSDERQAAIHEFLGVD